MTATTTTILGPLYRSTCVRSYPQLRTAGFCWSSFTACMPLVTPKSEFRLERRC